MAQEAIAVSHAEAAAQRRQRAARLRLAGRLTLHLILVIVAITFLVPTAWLVSSSLKASTEIFESPIHWIPSQPEWGNYVDAFTKEPMFLFARNSAIVVVAAVLGTLLTSTMVAYSFARLRWPGREFFFGLVVATMMLPDVVTLIPKFILFKQIGWVDTFLPLTVPYWFGGTAFYIFLMRQFFKTLPYELEEAARMDGATSLRILAQIMVPLSKPSLATVAVFAVFANYNDFLHPLIYLNHTNDWTLALGIRAFNDVYSAQWQLIFAAATAMLLPMVVLFFAAQRYFIEGIHLTGLAGR
ncbi:MAG TPA: carbohydrate ABC transporter permease [Chloroflexota bacterium]|nr:carbohydrate ABC transporter permease [Chloroflexota bacterium]